MSNKPFLIHVYVDRIAALDAIDKVKKLPGFAGYELPALLQHKPNGHAEPRAPREPRKLYEETGEETLIKILHGKPPMTNRQMADSFEALGRSRHSVNSLVHAMKASGDLEIRPDGYTLTKKVRDRMRHRKVAKKKR